MYVTPPTDFFRYAEGRITVLVSIGPQTSAALRAHGGEPDVEATRHDIDGLIEELVADAARRSPGC